MQNLFLAVLVTLIVFSQYMGWRPMQGADRTIAPRIYWVGTLSQEKPKQVAEFRDWLRKRGHADFEVAIDAQNRDISKIVIQTTSGIAGDVFDAYGSQVQYLYEMGILHGFKKGELAESSGVPDEDRFPGYFPTTDRDGLEYAVPFQISVDGVLVNRDAFAKVGLAPPPRTWDWKAFEETGKTFMKRANQNVNRPDHFFINNLQGFTLLRSAGISLFNETLTACAVDRGGRFEQIMALVYRWTYVDHIIPTQADLNSLSQEDSGFSQPAWQYFAKGRFALITGSRWLLMPLREAKCTNELDAVLYPHGGYPTTMLGCRYLVAYKGSKQLGRARLFASYLRSAEYNRRIIEGGDNLPPIPKYLDDPGYLMPSNHQTEWRLNASFREIALRHSAGAEETPFALTLQCERKLTTSWTSMMNGIHSPQQAASEMKIAVDREIAQYIKRHPEKKMAFDQARHRQSKIDALRAAGKKIPLSLVDNVFLKRYYADTGMGE